MLLLPGRLKKSVAPSTGSSSVPLQRDVPVPVPVLSATGPVLPATKPATPAVTDVPGLSFAANVVSREQEMEALKQIAAGKWDNTSLKRRVQHYGYKYLYSGTGLEPADPIPAWAKDLYELCATTGFGCSEYPDQVIVNEYAPGQGIGAHIDHERMFTDYVLVISLGGGCVMEFKHKDTRQIVQKYLPPRSVYKLQADARYQWTHAIPARKSDKVDGVVRRRETTRISVTFRHTQDERRPAAGRHVVAGAVRPRSVCEHECEALSTPNGKRPRHHSDSVSDHVVEVTYIDV
jgi:alkylated DNA repair dioxygenase AlkB